MMDLAVMLIKSAMRAFYTMRDIFVIYALILHEALRDDDLACLMAINTKDLHKICGELWEDRFLSVHTRQEIREGNPRPSSRTWYYINYRHTIDAIKWRVYAIDKEMQGNSVPANEKKEYLCPFCKAEWTAMEVLDNIGPSVFLCHRCHRTLTFVADHNSGGHEQSTRLSDQFKFISKLFPKIDSVHIPECDFDRALSQARSVVRDAPTSEPPQYSLTRGSVDRWLSRALQTPRHNPLQSISRRQKGLPRQKKLKKLARKKLRNRTPYRRGCLRAR